MKKKILSLLLAILCVVMMGALSSCLFEECTHEGTLASPVIENEKPAIGVEPGSYDEVVYCTNCKIEVTRTTILVVNTLVSSERFEVDGAHIGGTVASADEVLDLTEALSVSDKYTWFASADEAGEQILDKTAVELEPGDNTFYIHLTDTDGELTVFTVDIYRKKSYMVGFKQTGGTTPEGTAVREQIVDEGECAVVPEIVRPGYVLVGFYTKEQGVNAELFDFSEPIYGDVVLYPEWKLDDTIPWTVEYYFQNIDDDEYTLDESLTYVGHGTMNSFVTAPTPALDGFKVISYQHNGHINVDGSLVIKVYYDRNTYTVETRSTRFGNGYSAAGSASGGGTYRYGKEIKAIAYTRPGYIFKGWWYVDASNSWGAKASSDAVYTFTVTEDVVICAYWEVMENVPYTVYYRLQDLEGDGYTIFEEATFVGYGKTGDKVEAEIKEFEGFVRNTKIGQSTCTILGDGTGSINVFYDRVSCDVSMEAYYSGKVTGAQTYRWGAEAKLTVTPSVGYDFAGWYLNGELVSTETSISFVVTENIKYGVKFVPRNDTKVTVLYYLERKSGSSSYPNYTMVYPTAYTESEVFYGTTGTTVSVGNSSTDTFAAKSFPGYYLESYNTNNKKSGYVSGDGSLILKLYYKANTYYVSAVSANENGGTVTAPSVYIPYGLDATVEAKAKTGYSFVGWFDADDNLVSTEAKYTFKVAGRTNLTAKWLGDETSYTVWHRKASPTSEGQLVESFRYEARVGDTVTATLLDSILAEGYILRPGSEDTLTATVKPNGALTINVYYVDLNKGYLEEIDGEDYIYFGEYPQTLKAEDVTITDETDSRGYFKGSDGYWYAKVIAQTYNNTTTYKFGNGEKISDGAEYYFKVELIRWRVIRRDYTYNHMILLCDSIIAAEDWGVRSSSVTGWVDSSIRVWLNNTFYETAFNEYQKNLIYKNNSVANSVDTMNPQYVKNLQSGGATPYSATTFDDKVFLASYKDLVTSSYGFSMEKSAEDEERMKVGTDYAKAMGLWVSDNGNSDWWLRSRGGVIDGRYGYGVVDASIVQSDGSCDGSQYVDKDYVGVAPVIALRM